MKNFEGNGGFGEKSGRDPAIERRNQTCAPDLDGITGLAGNDVPARGAPDVDLLDLTAPVKLLQFLRGHQMPLATYDYWPPQKDRPSFRCIATDQKGEAS